MTPTELEKEDGFEVQCLKAQLDHCIIIGSLKDDKIERQQKAIDVLINGLKSHDRIDSDIFIYAAEAILRGEDVDQRP